MPIPRRPWRCRLPARLLLAALLWTMAGTALGQAGGAPPFGQMDSLERAAARQEGVERLGSLMRLMELHQRVAPSKGLSLAPEALELARRHDRPDLAAQVKALMGELHQLRGDAREALRLYFEALGEFEAMGQEEATARAFNDIGHVYNSLADTAMASLYFRKALDLYQKVGHRRGVAQCYNYLGSISFSKGDFASAREQFMAAWQNFELEGDTAAIVVAMNNLAGVYDKLGDYEQALGTALRALDLARLAQDRFGQTNSLNSVATFRLRLSQREDAFASLLEAVSIGIEIEDRPTVSASYLLMAQASEQSGELEKALFYYKKHMALKDSLDWQRLADSARDYETRYLQESARRKTQEVELQQKRSEQTLLMVFFLAAAMTALFLLYLYNSQKQQRQKLLAKNQEIREQRNSLRQINIELAKAKEQAQESDRLKAAFLANISHEIRTPINAILGFSELLKMPELKEEKRAEYFEIISANIRSLLSLIEDILLISKIETQQVQYELRNTSVLELLTGLHARFGERLRAKGRSDIELVFNRRETAERSLMVTDALLLERVLANLLDNALKFTRQGRVEFGYERRPGNKMLFFVADTGIGIAHRKQRDIFKPFRQADSSLTRAYGGTGLGLAICKAVVEMLGGQIWLESEEGLGTTVHISLPTNLVESKPIHF